MRVAARAALMLSLMAMGEVVRGEPSPLIMSLRSRRVRHFLDVGALGVVWGVDAAGAGFAVTGAFRPDGLAFTQPCKMFQAKSLQRIKEFKGKRILDNLILLRVTFSIIVFESLRRIARWVVFAVISFFCKLPNTTPSHPLF